MTAVLRSYVDGASRDGVRTVARTDPAHPSTVVAEARLADAALATAAVLPFGGMKESSSGSREQGKAAGEFFTEWKTVYLGPPA